MDVFIVPSLQRGNAAFDAQASCPLYRDRQASALTLWSMGAIPKGTAPITPPLKMVFFIPPFEKKRGGWGGFKTGQFKVKRKLRSHQILPLPLWQRGDKNPRSALCTVNSKPLGARISMI